MTADQGPAGDSGQQEGMERIGARFRPAQGAQGSRGKPGISAGARNGIVALLLLVLVVGGGNLLTSWNETHAVSAQLAAFKHRLAAQQAAEARAGAALERALCADVGTMAAIRAPAGNPATNPSRAYEDAEQRAWAGLVLDLRCRR